MQKFESQLREKLATLYIGSPTKRKGKLETVVTEIDPSILELPAYEPLEQVKNFVHELDKHFPSESFITLLSSDESYSKTVKFMEDSFNAGVDSLGIERGIDFNRSGYDEILGDKLFTIQVSHSLVGIKTDRYNSTNKVVTNFGLLRTLNYVVSQYDGEVILLSFPTTYGDGEIYSRNSVRVFGTPLNADSIQEGVDAFAGVFEGLEKAYYSSFWND